MARILVIEDNPDNLELITYLLEAYGHVVLQAGDGERGIEAVRREGPDLVLCDIHLPGADGYAVARRLKNDAAGLHVPLVAVTALAMVGDREKILAAGFDGYITKPINPQMFVADVDAFLRDDQRGSAPRDKQETSTSIDATQPASTRRATRATLLVVDDSPTNQELIYQTLSPFGYDVHSADNVVAAFEMAQSEPPDLILSDLHMPGEDGFDFVRRIKADPNLTSVPIIFISSSVWGERDRETATRMGVTRFLLRPIEPHVLLKEIDAVLSRQRAEGHGENPRG
jgi:two-component system cell cycle response regulator